MKEILVSPFEQATKPIDRLLDDLLQDLVIPFGKKDCNENDKKKGGDRKDDGTR